MRRFGFAYGTLAQHAESGEERFTVEWNREMMRFGTTSLRFLVPVKCLPDWGIRSRACFKSDLPRVRSWRCFNPWGTDRSKEVGSRICQSQLGSSCFWLCCSLPSF
jgi:uncharacterized protein (UPF0548 family)